MGSEALGQEPVVVSDCSETDLQEIARILEQAPEAAMWSDRALRESLVSAADTFLAARIRSEIAGFIAGRSMGEDAEILNLAVKESRRRRGVGTVLAVALLARYGEQKIRRVFLEVRESNRGAIALYEGLGFKQVGRRPDYYRDPAEAALILAKETCL